MNFTFKLYDLVFFFLVQDDQRQFSIQEGSYLTLNEDGKELLQNSNRKASEQLQSELDGIQKLWYSLNSLMKRCAAHLSDILKEWHSTDDNIVELQDWLQEVKEETSREVTSQYDSLSKHRKACSVSKMKHWKKFENIIKKINEWEMTI